MFQCVLLNLTPACNRSKVGFNSNGVCRFGDMTHFPGGRRSPTVVTFLCCKARGLHACNIPTISGQFIPLTGQVRGTCFVVHARRALLRSRFTSQPETIISTSSGAAPGGYEVHCQADVDNKPESQGKGRVCFLLPFRN